MSTIRTDINKNPELSWKEFKTTEIICGFLSQNNIPFKKLDKGGVIAGKGKVLLRAELDALPFGNEVKHACGHDVHMAALLEALKEVRNFTAVFQPSEEDYPSGAKYVLEHLEEYDCAIALHVDPTLDIGKIGLRSGYVMGSVDLLRINVKGKSAHTANPEEGRDAILAASEVVNKINSAFPSKKCSVVISKIKGGEKDNIVCDSVSLEGTSRALDEELRWKIKDVVNNICKEVGLRHDLEINFEFVEGYPSLYNNRTLVDKLRESLNKEFVVVQGKPCLANDDFAYFGERSPICYIRVGCGSGKLHTKDFYPSDEVVDICKKVFIISASLNRNI